MLARCQLAGGHAQLQLKVLPQHLDQGWVKARLVLVRLQRKARARAFALEQHRQQNQRRFDAHLGLVWARPDQKAQRDKQRIGAALLQRIARPPVQIHQPHVQLLVFQADEDFFALQGLGSVRAVQIFQTARLVQLLAARVLADHQLAAGQQLDALAGGQRVFQRRSRHFQQQRAFALAKIQQHVAQRQIEQLALPARQPVFRVEFGGGDFGQRRIAQQSRRVFDGDGHALQALAVHGRWRWGDGFGQRQRADARHAGAFDIDHQLEFVVLGLGQLARGLGDGLAKAHRLALRGQGGLKHQHLLQLHALAHGGDVVNDAAGKHLFAQPDTDKGVAARKHQQRAEAGLLQAGRKQQR